MVFYYNTFFGGRKRYLIPLANLGGEKVFLRNS